MEGLIIETLKTFWAGLDWSVLSNLLLSIIPALLCITVHELCHGLVAYKLGDNTAKNAGRLTLNPIKHIDIIGLIMMVIFRFGWAKPVPVNMNNFKNPKAGMAITALAGPVSNILLAAVVLFIYGLLFPVLITMGDTGELIIQTILTTVWLSCALAIFNFIPMPPLDGSKVLFSVLSEKHYYMLIRYERFGMIALMIVLYTGILSPVLNTLTGGLNDWLLNIAIWSNGLVA